MPLPARIWRCPFCDSDFIERWRLKRHLVQTHRRSERRARIIAENSEYWLRTRMEYVNPQELEFEEDREGGIVFEGEEYEE